MAMETKQKEAAGSTGRARILSASRGPKRIAFRIPKRGFSSVHSSRSLLIINRFGVWSMAHRRYIRQTRYSRLCILLAGLRPVKRAYCSLHRLGMSSWAECGDQAMREMTFWKHRLIDIYWQVAGDNYRGRAIRYYLRRVKQTN